jgi:hypothetical protein
MPVAEPQTICLTQHMADKDALWQESLSSTSSRASPTWISSLGHLQITCLVQTGM